MFKALTIAMLAGLAAGPAYAAPVPPRATTIIYEMGPCHGFCPVYRISVSANGRGVFTGIRNTQVGKRSFRVSRRQYRAFAAQLESVRPAGERLLIDQTQCTRFATDMSSVDVRWLSAGRPSHLAYNFGCDREANAAMAEALRAAPKALPIGSMIGSH